ncbi:MAG: TIGR00266 family protein [Acidobacteria bacterium]|nr:MAG: TIGR00266 family protein [Acidobacteriota bacterium]
MSDSNTWYIAVAGQQQGPMSQDDLLQKLRTGEISQDTYVFKTGMKDWAPVSSIPNLNAPPVPPPAPDPTPGAIRSHEIDFEVFGEEMQFVEIELDPRETVIAEAGAMMFMETGIEMDTRFGDGSQPDKGFMGKLFEGAKRKLTGESLFMTWFTNMGHGKKRVAFGAPYPGKIIPIDLKEIGGLFICQKDAFLCAAMGTQLGLAFNKRIGTGLFGGEGFIMQKLEGDGKAFVHAGGTIVKKKLAPGEILKIDTGCIVGYTGQINYDIQMVKGLKSMFFGGEGLFLATLTGPGDVWLQSLPFSRLADRIYAAAPQTGGGRSVGEGSVLGALGDMIGGD